MKASMLGVSILALVLFGSAYVASAADDASKSSTPAGAAVGASADKASAPQEASAKSEARPDARSEARGGRLTKPWRDLTSLSEDQKKQITAIHRKAVQEVNAVEEREKTDIMALLNEQQKSELKSIQEKEAADRKAKAGNRTTAKSSANTDKKQ